MHIRQNEGVYIHLSQWAPYEKEFIIPNGKRAQAIKMQQVWALEPTVYKKWVCVPNPHYIPEKIKCFNIVWEWAKIPAGLVWLQPSKFIPTYDNKVIAHPSLTRESYDYQSQTVSDLMQRSTGLVHASTGSGKTQMICEIIYRAQRNTLIMVQNLTQMTQMVDDIHSLFDINPQQVSGKKVSKKEQDSWYPYITVCSIDSREKVNPHDYGLILLDEADTYLGSDDRREWIGNLSPEYMYALTGTVKINNVDDSVFRLYYGPTTRLEMLHLTPTYAQVLSNFTYTLEDIKDFHEMKTALYSDEKRNKLIVDTVVTKGKGRKWLVFTEHIEHARWLAEELSARGIKTFLLIGEIWKEERERIRQEVKSHDGDVCIVWSVKIIGRGFDLPEISFAVLTTCEKFTSNIEQYLGRIIRKFDGKPAPILYDITDQFQYLLNNQSRSRIATFRKTFPTGKTIIL